ncbi:hypothetical protein BGZ94_000383 [Podila epigama]|nr:hypothetical protein BGZ94_000383 [Podila epigama]
MNASTKKRVSPKSLINTRRPSITTTDPHSKHLKDGLEHHILEDDGQDRHHIWFKDFENGPDVDNNVQSNKSSARDAPTHRSSSLRIIADHKHRRLHVESGNNDVESYGQDNHHTSPGGHGHPETHRDGLPKSKDVNIHTNTKTSIPMRHLGSSTTSRDGVSSTTHYFKGTNSTTNTTTTSTTTIMSPNEQEGEHRRSHTRDEAAIRSIAQKSHVDRQKAREAILLLDQDLIQMQKLLQEKEDALRAAEAKAAKFHQVTIRTETLTREIHDLEITIRDLRSNLQVKDAALEQSQKKMKEHHHHEKEQKKVLEAEISKLRGNLHQKERLEHHSKELQKNLDDANAKRAQLIVQVRELSEAIKQREGDLKSALSALKKMEQSNGSYKEGIQRLSGELEGLRKDMADRERQLKDCHRKIKSLDGVQEEARSLEVQLRDLRGQLSDRDTTIKSLGKENKSLVREKDRANRLAGEVKELTHDIHDRERQLQGALKSAKELQKFKTLATDLEDELKSLREQVVVQEKHLTYLEDALQSHENCALDIQKLQNQIGKLQALIHEKEANVHELRKANKDLQKKDARIATLEDEIKTFLNDMKAKEKEIESVKEKAEHDIAKISSTASTLRLELESLRQQLEDKNRAMQKANKDLEALDIVKNTNMTLTVEITRLEKHIASKDHQLQNLEKMVERMRGHEKRASELHDQVKRLEKENHIARKSAEQAASDASASTSTASQLRVEVESLRQQLAEKSDLLRDADKVAKELEHKSLQIKELLDKIAGLEELSHRNGKKVELTEQEVKALKIDITTLKGRLHNSQNELKVKEADLQEALTKAGNDQEVSMAQLKELRGEVLQLRKLLKNTEKDARQQHHLHEQKIRILENELQEWGNHEATWMQQANELTQELEKKTEDVRRKGKSLHDVKHKMSEKDAEIGRLNDVVRFTRSELSADRKRRASEIEDQVAERTRQHRFETQHLKRKISDLEDHVVDLSKRIRLEHDRDVKEQELGQRIQELNVWKQNAVQQAKEWEATAAHFEHERKSQEFALSSLNGKVKSLQSQLEEADAWRLKAIMQAEQLTVMIAKLEAELSMVKGVLAKHDANDAQMSEAVRTMKETIKSLESSRSNLRNELAARNSDVNNLKLQLKQASDDHRVQKAHLHNDLANKDKKLEDLQARLTDYSRKNAEFELAATRNKGLLARLESSNDKLKGTVAVQMEQLRALENKYQSSQLVQANQDKELVKLKRTLQQVTAEDKEKAAKLRSRVHHLEMELEQNGVKIKDLQVQVHNSTRQYHNALASLEKAKEQMSGMVPAERANHDACAARIRDGEQMVTELEGRVEDLQTTIQHLAQKLEAQGDRWAVAESENKERIERLQRGRGQLETKLHDMEHSYNKERQRHEQDRLGAEREAQKKEGQIQALRRANMHLQKEFSVMETRMKSEMSITKNLTDLLTRLRNSIKRDSEAELRSLDELEKELKLRSIAVVETIQVSRKRMDSGAFLEGSENVV